METLVSQQRNLYTELTNKNKTYNEKILKIKDSNNRLREIIHKTLDDKINKQIKIQIGKDSDTNNDPIGTFSELKTSDVGRTLANTLLGLQKSKGKYESDIFNEIMKEFDQKIVEVINELKPKIKPKTNGGSGKKQYGGSENFILYLIATFVGTYLVVVGSVYLNNVQKTTSGQKATIFGHDANRETAEIVFIMFILTGSFILCGVGRILIPLFSQRAQQEDIYDIMERMGRANGQPAEQGTATQAEPANSAIPPPQPPANDVQPRVTTADRNLFDRLGGVNAQGDAVVNAQGLPVNSAQGTPVDITAEPTDDARVVSVQPMTRSNSPIVQAFWFQNQSVARHILRNVIPTEAYFPQTVSIVDMDNLVKTYAVLNVFIPDVNLNRLQTAFDRTNRQSILVDNVLVGISTSITGLNYLCKISLFHDNEDLNNNPANIDRWIEIYLPGLYKILTAYSQGSAQDTEETMPDFRLIDYIEKEDLYDELDIPTDDAINGDFSGGKGRIRKSVKSRKTKRRRATRRRRTKK